LDIGPLTFDIEKAQELSSFRFRTFILKETPKMYCGNCGNALEDHFRYCSGCGAPTVNAAAAPPPRGYGFTRPREGNKLAGVCAGIARYLDLDVTLVRIVWLIMVFYPPAPGVLAYLICWILMPLDPLPARQEVTPVA
jgi:phage shock protein C